MKSAEVLVKFKGDTKDLNEKTAQAKSSLKGFASGISSAFKVATAGITACTTAVVGLIKKSVDGYAEFEQLEGGLISLFGEGSAEMNRILKDSEEAYKTLTMSQNDYLTNFQSSYPLVNAGLSENADGIEYTNKMLQLSSDLFNTYGGSIDYYQNAINWALKGSFVYLDNLNLGIKGTQEGFIEAANSSGILGRNIQDVSELTTDEIIDVIQHYAQAYGVWGKTGQEASDTIIGSMNMVKATWSNFITGIAKKDADIDKLIDQLINSAMTFVNNVVPVIMRALTGLADALPKLAEQIGEQIPTLINGLVPPLITAITTLINAVLKALPGLLRTLVPILVESLLSIVDAVIDILPDLIDTLLDAVIVIINAISNALPTLLPKLVEVIVESIIKIVDYLPDILKAGIQLFMGLVKALPLVIKALVKELPKLIRAWIDAMVEYYPALVEGTIELFMALIDAIPDIIDALIEALPQIIDAIVYGLVEGIPKLLEALWKIGERLFSAVGEVGTNIGNSIMEFVNNIPYYIGVAIGYIVGAITKFIAVDIPNFINGIITWVSELPGKILNIINEILNWISQLPGKVMQYIADLFQSIVNTIKELPGKMLDIGKNIVQGLWNGILNAKDWVVNKVKSFAKGILDGMKSALGIHSPSTEFAVLGKFSVLGYTEELEKMKGKIDDTIANVFNLQPNINGNMSSTYSPQMNVIVNNNLETDPLGQLVNSVKTFSGGAKNDYNWGAGL